MKYQFIQENSHREKVKSIIIVILITLFVITIGAFFTFTEYTLLKETPFLDYLTNVVKTDIRELTPMGLFYYNFLGGLFFVPSIEEFIFYFALVRGNPIVVSFILSYVGYILAQVFNYYLGTKLSSFIFHIVSKRKMYKTRRFVNKYGAYGIFFFNLIPSPAPLLTLALGIAKYNKYRLFIFITLGKALKYLAIIIIYKAIY